MRLFSNHPLFSDESVRAFCWTLLHSLWQGLLLALLAALVLFFTKKTTAALRYRLLGFLLAIFIGGVCLTFNLQWRHELDQAIHGKPVVLIDGKTLSELSDAAAAKQPLLGLVSRDYVDDGVSFFNAHASTICLLWILVFMLKCLKMGLDLYLIRRLRYRGAVAPLPEWQHRVRELAKKLSLRSPVSLLESGFVQVPSVIGILKPVILIPIGMLAQLPAEQVEAILLHELAHIRRQDFLVNLLQHFAETIFFFNPAVLWVSTLLREEREHCCDEMAVAAMNHKSGYLNALLHFQELNLSGANYAAAFPGTHRGQLRYRVQRILGLGNTKTLNNMEKITLISCVLMAGLFWLLPVDDVQAQTQKIEKERISTINITGEGTAAELQEMTVRENNGKTYVMKRVEGKVKEMTIDGKKVPDDQLGNYDSMIRKIDAEIKADMAQAERDRAQAKLDMEQAERDRERAELDRAQAERDREQAELDVEQAKRDVEQAARDREQAERDRAQAKRDIEQSVRDREQAEKDRAQSERDRAQSEIDRAQSKRDVEQAMRDREQAEKDKAQAIRDRKQAQKDREIMGNLIAELVQDGLIQDKKSLSALKLNDKTFEVNGKKLSDDLHRKYKAKYAKELNYEIQYNGNGYNMSSGHGKIE
ncbi:MAG: M56 family metallopeptidase [Saprospiraceae bacterium]|nr:M56 family metallopeptidase [Saprospiraceae bacterium]MDZ4706647.1 M56 family metallopeptidase [Saprospiraceae bacterium]